jgi:hypothetical protein
MLREETRPVLPVRKDLDTAGLVSERDSHLYTRTHPAHGFCAFIDDVDISNVEDDPQFVDAPMHV